MVLNNLKIKNFRLKTELIQTTNKLMSLLEKIYKEEPEETKKALSIIIAVVLLKGYDNKQELQDAIKQISEHIME